MAIRKDNGHTYGDEQADLRGELDEYSATNGYPVHHAADARCACGGRTFELAIDDGEGVALRVCRACGHEHWIGDSADFLDDAELEACECLCGESAFEVTLGVSLYPGAEAVRWLYVAARCSSCGLLGVYGDWKNEFDDYRELLARA